MEFLVEFDVSIQDGTPESEVTNRQRAEASAAAELVDQGHLVRLWKPRVAPSQTKTVGLYRADSDAQLDDLLAALPLYERMDVTVTPLEPHPNDPAPPGGYSPSRREPAISNHLPDPRLTRIYRLEATPGQPLDLGDTAQGHRRIVPLIGGTFTGPELTGALVPGASADWQTVLPDDTALGDIRYTLRTDGGALLYVQTRGVRHGSAEVLARLGRGEDVDPASTRSAPQPRSRPLPPTSTGLTRASSSASPAAGRQV
jgi:muconolactone delta-isomerase